MSKRNTIFIVVAMIVVILSFGFFFFSKLHVNPITRTINPRAYGSLCGEIVGTCNGLTAINCKAEVDGPYYYVNTNTGAVVATCGGACDRAGGCQPGTCPPKEWTCGTDTIRSDGSEQACGTIITPKPNVIVASGSEVEVQINYKENPWDVVEFSSDEGGVTAEIDPQTGVGVLKIPASSSGPMRFSLIGTRGGDALCENEPIELIVRPTAKITELFVLPIRITLREGETKQLLVSAEFNDGVDRDAGSSAVGTIYKSADTSIATVDDAGLVRARHPGITTINVTNGAIYKNVTTQVLSAQSAE